MKITSSDESGFDVSRAELFEALGHHTRITILQALEEKPMSFSELRRRVGIESNGLLSFHLGKLTYLVSTSQDGNYTLTDQGREAVRMIDITRSPRSSGPVIKVRSHDRRPYLVVISVLLAFVIALGAVAVYQQNQLTTHDPVLVYGTLAGSWARGITPTSSSARIVFASSSGSNTTVLTDSSGHYWVSLLGGQYYGVTIYWNSNLSCSTACWTIISAPPTVNATVSPCPVSGCPTQHLMGGNAYVIVMPPSPTSTRAVASGTNFGYILDLNSTTGSYNYNLSF